MQGNAHEFRMSVADISAGEFTGAVTKEQLPAGEAVVHTAWGFSRASRGFRLKERHDDHDTARWGIRGSARNLRQTFGQCLIRAQKPPFRFDTLLRET